jgi:hypothetical protein
LFAHFTSFFRLSHVEMCQKLTKMGVSGGRKTTLAAPACQQMTVGRRVNVMEVFMGCIERIWHPATWPRTLLTPHPTFFHSMFWSCPFLSVRANDRALSRRVEKFWPSVCCWRTINTLLLECPNGLEVGLLCLLVLPCSLLTCPFLPQQLCCNGPDRPFASKK